LFSLSPIVLITVSVTGLFFGKRAARGELFLQIQQITGEQLAFIIQNLLASSYDFRSGILATIIGIIALLFGATAVFAELQSAMDTIWEVKRSRMSLIDFLKIRLLAFMMILGIGMLLIFSLVAGALFSIFLGQLEILSHYLPLYRMGDFLVSFALITILFGMIYKILPSTEVSWRDVWLGAVITSFLFTLGKLLIGIYLSRSMVSTTFGAAGSLVVLLFWIYYSAQVFFFGAELTHAYSNKFGTGNRKKRLA
jgi:membrane protein